MSCIVGLGILSVLFESSAEINTAYLSSLERQHWLILYNSNLSVSCLSCFWSLLLLELVEASEDDREAEVPGTAIHLDHPRSYGLTTRTATYINDVTNPRVMMMYRFHTICLLTSRYYATIECCGECSIAWHGAGAGPGWCRAGGRRAVERHRSLDTTRAAGNEPSQCFKLRNHEDGTY